MKFTKLILFFLLPSFLFSEPKSEIEISWEKSGEFSYRVQAKDKDEKVFLDELTKENNFQFQLSEGEYLYRIGVVDSENTIWADWKKITVIKKKYSDKENNFSEKEEESNGFIKLEWENLEGANFFVVQVRDETGKKLIRKKLKQNQFSFEMPEGSYEYRVGVNDGEETSFGEWKKFSVKKKILEVTPAKEEPKPEVKDIVTEKKVKYNYDRWSVFWRSSLVPGLGQRWRKDKTWHYLFYPITMLGLTTAYISVQNKNASFDKKFDKDERTAFTLTSLDPNSPTLFLFALPSLISSIETKEKVNKTYEQGIQIGGAIGFVYVFNLIDALFFHDYSVPVYPEESKIYQNFHIQLQSSNQNSSFEYSIGYRF